MSFSRTLFSKCESIFIFGMVSTTHSSWPINVPIIIFMKIKCKYKYFMFGQNWLSRAYLSIALYGCLRLFWRNFCRSLCGVNKMIFVVMCIWFFFFSSFTHALTHIRQQLSCNWCQGTMTLIWWWKLFDCVCVRVHMRYGWMYPAATF